MIKPGNIVYRIRRGGLIHNNEPAAIKDKIGLVIKEIKETNSVAQFYVKFDQEAPKWFYQHDLQRIGGERKEDVKHQNKHCNP